MLSIFTRKEVSPLSILNVGFLLVICVWAEKSKSGYHPYLYIFFSFKMLTLVIYLLYHSTRSYRSEHLLGTFKSERPDDLYFYFIVQKRAKENTRSVFWLPSFQLFSYLPINIIDVLELADL